MGYLKDFKEFAYQGNVIDLAVAVIIGAAFGKIVTAVVDDLIMPLVGMLVGAGQKFTDLFYVLSPGKSGTDYKSLAQARADGANVLAYGDFLQSVVDFLIIAFVIFLTVSAMKRMLEKKKESGKEIPVISKTDELLTEIRDELKRKA
jgi:large conductance mechanosensitive channel